MKKIIIILVIFVLLSTAAIIYLNNVVLPTRIKSLIVKGLQEQTHKNVSLESVQFNIFKGLVLRNLVIYDNNETFATFRESSFTFLIWPIFKKMIIIPNVRLRSPVILLERKKDGSFNLQDLFVDKTSQPKPQPFNILIYKVSVIEATVHFKDDALDEPFVKDIEHINLRIQLALPAKVKFNLKSQISGLPVIKINAQGEFKIPQQELTAKISVQDLSPLQFMPYYKNSGINISNGQVDASVDLRVKDNTISADVLARARNMELTKDKTALELNSDIQSSLQYSLKDKQLKCFGKAKIIDFAIKTAAADIIGKGNLSLTVATKVLAAGPIELSGDFEMIDTVLKSKNLNSLIQNINGRLEFNLESLKWSDLNFQYLDVPYKTTGSITNFPSPQVQLQLTSKDLFLESGFSISNGLIDITQFSGKYINSTLSLKGKVDTANLESDLNAELNFDLQDTKQAFKKFKDRLEQIKLIGILNLQLSLKGKLNDFKSCLIKGNVSSAEISVFGLKTQDLSLIFNQADGSADISSFHLSLYDGLVNGKANIDLNSPNIPYGIEADLQGLKLEKLKQDTPLKTKDLAGTLQAHVKLNGMYSDLAKLNGCGNIAITDGKLWQLNLFQGLGSLLFAKDFANIVFSEGSCGFTVQDKHVFSDNLSLKSNIIGLSGTVNIGFDSSIDSSIDVQVKDEMVPLTGTLKDFTTAVIGQGGKFGVIKISGTLKKPKYKFKPAVTDIIKGITNAIFGQ